MSTSKLQKAHGFQKVFRWVEYCNIDDVLFTPASRSKRILVACPDKERLSGICQMLAGDGFVAIAVSSFPQAKRLLETDPLPDLLVAEVRLGPFNGIHLAVRRHVSYPSVPVVIADPSYDPVAERSAREAGAHYVVDPGNNPQFLPTVRRLLSDQRFATARRWTRRPFGQIVQIDAAGTPAEILDISYGGIKLRLQPGVRVPDVFEVFVPEFGARVAVRRVWIGEDRTKSVECGVSVDDERNQDWRRFVDSV